MIDCVSYSGVHKGYHFTVRFDLGAAGWAASCSYRGTRWVSNSYSKLAPSAEAAMWCVEAADPHKPPEGRCYGTWQA